MKAFKYILFLLLILIIGMAIYVAIQPNEFEVSRTRTINAPSQVVYNQVIDLKNWEAWSSWAESDPDMRITLSEQTKGIGGSYSWEDKDGAGNMKITETIPNTSIQQEMQFEDMPASNVSWNFQENKDGATQVKWTISGKDLTFKFKAFTTLIGGIEKEIAPHYERSLEKLDSIVLASMQVYSVNINGITQHGGGYYIYNTASCKISDLPSKMEELMPKITSYTKQNSITMAGAPFTSYHKWDIENNAVMFSCCIPTTEKVITSEPDILTGQLKPFKAIKTTLKGNYTNLKEAWETASNYIKTNNLEEAPDASALEVYRTEPSRTPNPADWITEIYIPIK